MVTKTEITLQQNIDLGKRCNLLFGETPSTARLGDYVLRREANLNSHNFDTRDFSQGEMCRINGSINAALRAGIGTVGALRITEPRVLRTKEGIGSNRLAFLEEAFKHVS